MRHKKVQSISQLINHNQIIHVKVDNYLYQKLFLFDVSRRILLQFTFHACEG